MKTKYPAEKVKDVRVTIRFTEEEYQELVRKYGAKKLGGNLREALLKDKN